MVNKARLTAEDIACWVIKSQRPPRVIAPGWRPGAEERLTRCLRRSYRVELFQPGQRSLLWLSGRDEPGVHAIGSLVTKAHPRPGETRAESEIEVALWLLSQPVPRADLLADHTLSSAEVLRMPAGSNPSYLTHPQFDALADLIAPADLPAAGWSR